MDDDGFDQPTQRQNRVRPDELVVERLPQLGNLAS
jgi:hypothetical protein